MGHPLAKSVRLCLNTVLIYYERSLKLYFENLTIQDEMLISNLYTLLGKTSKKNGTVGGEGVRKIIEFSSFTNDEKHEKRGGVSE